jgi:hypothetical protein
MFLFIIRFMFADQFKQFLKFFIFQFGKIIYNYLKILKKVIYN